MHDLYEQTKELLIKILDTHVSNIWTDPTFHEFLNIYNDILVITHDIWEKSAAIWEPIEKIINEDARQEIYDEIDSLKTSITDFIKADKPTIWADNKLRSILDDLEQICIKSEWFIEEDNQEDNESNND